MPREKSPRAAARARYRVAAALKNAENEDGACRPAPDRQPSLTERVRALYEDSIVPVREIARLAGVSERTIYKYAQRGGWRRRHVCLAREDRYAKGAGGRFVCREDRDQPHPSGLKAFDPEGAARASALCERAAELSAEAEAAAIRAAARRQATLREQRDLAVRLRTCEMLGSALADLAEGYARGTPRYVALGGRLQDAMGTAMAQALVPALGPP